MPTFNEKYLNEQELERWRKGVYGRLIPRYVAAALNSVSRNSFDKYFGHLISPVKLRGRSKNRPLYKLEEVLALVQTLETEPIIKKPAPDYTFYTNIRQMMECCYKEIETN